jgi:signal transduction histidine kinase
VQDEGPGLDLGELDHLFERFFRGHAARQASFGTGMGLAITRGLLSAENGQVWAENVPGSGARFTITVPGTRRAVAPVEADL